MMDGLNLEENKKLCSHFTMQNMTTGYRQKIFPKEEETKEAILLQ